METVIHPDINADEKLRPLVEETNRLLEDWLGEAAPEKAIWWKDADEFGQTLIRLEYRRDGDSISRRFKPEELNGSLVMCGRFSRLYRELIGKQFQATVERMLTNLREWREELEAEEEAKSLVSSEQPQEAH